MQYSPPRPFIEQRNQLNNANEKSSFDGRGCGYAVLLVHEQQRQRLRRARARDPRSSDLRLRIGAEPHRHAAHRHGPASGDPRGRGRQAGGRHGHASGARAGARGRYAGLRALLRSEQRHQDRVGARRLPHHVRSHDDQGLLYVQGHDDRQDRRQALEREPRALDRRARSGLPGAPGHERRAELPGRRHDGGRVLYRPSQRALPDHDAQRGGGAERQVDPLGMGRLLHADASPGR